MLVLDFDNTGQLERGELDGVAAALGYGVDPMSILVPFLMFAIGVSHGVQMVSAVRAEAAQFPILAYVSAAVVAHCLVSFRSVAATICIVVPLAVVALLAYGLMALLEIGLEVSTLPVVVLDVRIGVDYGIYIYGRLCLHLARGLDFAEAYERTLARTGAGVALTGLTLAAGVAIWIVAPLKFQADMGTVLTFMFLVNMVGAVVLLPALGAWLVKRRL